MLVRDLKGALLSYWTAQAQGMQVRVEYQMTNPPRPSGVWRYLDSKIQFSLGPYIPHINPEQARELQIKYRLSVISQTNTEGKKLWCAVAEGDPLIATDVIAETIEEAICMRVVVAKFGYHVADTVFGEQRK